MIYGDGTQKRDFIYVEDNAMASVLAMEKGKAGGAERTIYEVGTRLSKLNIEVHLVTVNPGNLLEYENVEGIITHRIKENIKTHLYVRKMIKEINPDVIIDDMGHAVPLFLKFYRR